MQIFGLQRRINDYPEEPLLAILPGVALQELWQIVGVAEKALIGVSAMVVVTALMGMMVMIFASLNERRREIAIWRAMGARPATILGLLVLEAMRAAAAAAGFRKITWDDLIPLGVPYSEIIGDGEVDETNDVWKPEFDENATKLNTALNGTPVKLPGSITPLELGAEGVTSFVLVPYVGACIHVPPPPPNQLVFVTTATPWPSDNLWDAVWVSGLLSAKLQSTEIAEIGYQIEAERIEIYEW